MNLTSTSRFSGRTPEKLALAGSLFLHVGLIAFFSFWQWEWQALEKTPPKTVNVKFITTPSSSHSTETPNSPEPSPMTPARPLTIQSISKSQVIPRTPDLSMPILQTVKMAQQRIRTYKKTVRRPRVQPTSLATTPLFPAVAPANFSQYNEQTLIHRRSPALEIRTSKILDSSARTAISTGPPQLESNTILPLPGPAQSMPLSQVGFASQPVAEQRTSKNTARNKFAALPKDLPQSSPSAHEAVPDADLGDLRGLFTGKVRQRIANAKYYPRTARRRGMEGQPVIAFTLDKSGQLVKVDLAQTSGYQLLDRAAVEAVHQAAPYPEIPTELQTDTFQFKLPISFVLK